jgi:hypothetical protein
MGCNEYCFKKELRILDTADKIADQILNLKGSSIGRLGGRK